MTAERKPGAAVTGSDRKPTFSAQPYVQIRPLYLPTYTPDGQLATRAWARGVTTTYAYTNGSMIAIDYSDSTPDVAFQYDRLGRMVAAIVAEISTNAYTYDPDTLAFSVEMQNGMEINRTTDAFGRDTGFSLAGSDYSVTYGYDTFGRFHSVSSFASLASFAVQYSYLPNSDLVSGHTLSEPVSSFEFQASRSYESGRSLITSVENRFGESVISRYDYANDALGRRTSRADSGLAFAAQPTYGDPATVEMPAYNAYSYNTRSEVTGAARRWGTPDAPGALVLGQQYAYEFDPIGNRITAAEGDTTRAASYTANALNQYSQRTVPDEKDMIGTAPTNVAVTVNQNSVSRQSAYWHHALEVDNATEAAYPDMAITAVYNPPGTNDPDVVTSTTGRVFVAQTPESFQFDSDGNLTQDGRFDYTWNGENRLIKVETRDDLPAAVPRVRVTHQYDHQSRRISSSTAAWTNDTWQAVDTRSFLYDGWNVVRETINHQPSTTNYYTWGLDLSGSLQGAGGVGGLLAASLDGTTALYCYDANGNVGQLVATNGDLLAHYEYDPFGNTVAATGVAATDNHFRFSTKYHEDESGLVYYGYRFYSAGLGRFLSRDPIAEAGWLLVRSVDLQFLALQKDTIDTYVFVLNEPVSRVDVLGALSFGGTMFGGPTGIGCGGFLWSIKWQRGPQELTGFIIQEVQYRHVAKDCGGAWLPGYPKQGTFYEAWEIGRHTEKDTFYNASVGKCTYGAKWVQGQAAFFWIGSLPGGFWPGRVSEAGSILPSSPDKPWFFGLTRSWISNYITRTLTASWVCCPSGSTTVWTTP